MESNCSSSAFSMDQRKTKHWNQWTLHGTLGTFTCLKDWHISSKKIHRVNSNFVRLDLHHDSAKTGFRTKITVALLKRSSSWWMLLGIDNLCNDVIHLWEHPSRPILDQTWGSAIFHYPLIIIELYANLHVDWSGGPLKKKKKGSKV